MGRNSSLTFRGTPLMSCLWSPAETGWEAQPLDTQLSGGAVRDGDLPPARAGVFFSKASQRVVTILSMEDDSMGRRIAADEEDNWDDYEPEDGPPDDDDTIPCPYCRRPIHEDAQRCPYCEHYISQEDAPPSQKPPWILLGILVCLAMVVLWILNR